MSIPFNSQYGFLTPENYWLMQNMLQSQGSYMPFMGMGYSPYFQGASGAAQNGSSATPTAPRTLKEQAKYVDEQLQAAIAQKGQLTDTVQLQNAMGEVVEIDKSLYNEKTGYVTADGKNDGKISGWEKLKNLGKGVCNLVTDMFFDENGRFSLKKTLSTVAIGAAVTVACMACPVLAPVALGAGLVLGGGTLVAGAYKAAVAKTDEEAEKAWQNIGSGTAQTVMAVLGAKSMGSASAAKAGVAAPKWYRPDQSIALATKTSWGQMQAAGGTLKYAKGQFDSMKVSVDKFVGKSGYSYYQHKYSNHLNYIDEQIANTTDANYKSLLQYLKKSYEGVFNASDDAAMRAAEQRLAQASGHVESYLAKHRATMPKDGISSVEKLLNISKSVAPKNANVVRTANLLKKSDAYSNILKGLDDEIAALRQSATTEADRAKLQILQKTRSRYRKLFMAKTPEEQQNALKILEKLNSEVMREIQRVRTTPGTTQETMKAYNDLYAFAQQKVLNADAVINARSEALMNARTILESNRATAAQIDEAKALINSFRPNATTTTDYVNAVESMLSEMSYQKAAGVFGKLASFKTSAWGKTQTVGKKAWNYAKTPEYQVLSVVNSTGPRFMGTQTTWGVGLTPVTTEERQQQLETLQKQIETLQNMQYELNHGRAVDLGNF